jgi:hypothetical protein
MIIEYMPVTDLKGRMGWTQKTSDGPKVETATDIIWVDDSGLMHIGKQAYSYCSIRQCYHNTDGEFSYFGSLFDLFSHSQNEGKTGPVLLLCEDLEELQNSLPFGFEALMAEEEKLVFINNDELPTEFYSTVDNLSFTHIPDSILNPFKLIHTNGTQFSISCVEHTYVLGELRSLGFLSDVSNSSNNKIDISRAYSVVEGSHIPFLGIANTATSVRNFLIQCAAYKIYQWAAAHQKEFFGG